MRVILCLDPRDGLSFNGRRQSRDRVVLSDMLESVDGPLAVTPTTARLFAEDAGLQIAKHPQETAATACFLETPPCWDGVSRLTVYRWQEVYPADCYAGWDRAAWRLIGETELVGYSHDVVIKEEWER